MSKYNIMQNQCNIEKQYIIYTKMSNNFQKKSKYNLT